MKVIHVSDADDPSSVRCLRSSSSLAIVDEIFSMSSGLRRKSLTPARHVSFSQSTPERSVTVADYFVSQVERVEVSMIKQCAHRYAVIDGSLRSPESFEFIRNAALFDPFNPGVTAASQADEQLNRKLVA